MIPAGPLRVVPLSRRPEVSVAVPGSKSITNRALVLAALAEGISELSGVLESDDTRYMRQCLEALGVEFEAVDTTTLRVRGGIERLVEPKEPLFVGNSGTTVRFLSAVAALVPGRVTLEGNADMAVRPISDLVQGLQQLGLRVDCPTGCPPLTVFGGTLQGERVSMRGDRSSQYFSALLMALGGANRRLELAVEGQLVSRPYLEITRSMVAAFGGAITESGEGFVVAPHTYRGRHYEIEPDASSASYFFALGAASSGRVEVEGLGQGALQGDYAFLELLERMGAVVTRGESSTLVLGPESLGGIHADMHHISDTAMTLAAIAPVMTGKTRIENVANIRIKETDRLLATVTELERLGQKVTHGADWFEVEPRPVQPAVVHCYNDHRIAMSFAILGLLRDGVTIEDPACVSKTFPTFWLELAAVYRACGDTAPWEEKR
jgi:3-phosphoshikimate 1-carboxyvinyltransferase